MKYAFVVSPYPIIISAEVHCSVPQQDTMASIMHEVFGECLVSAPVNGRPKIEVLPSPEDLKGRVLLKVCSVPTLCSPIFYFDACRRRICTSWRARKSSQTSSRLKLNLPRRPLRPLQTARSFLVRLSFPLSRFFIFTLVLELRHDLFRGISEAKQEVSKARNVLRRRSRSIPVPKADKGKARMSLSLVALLVYTVGVKCRGINKKEQYAPVHMFSLSENTANKMFKRNGMLDLVKHNRTHMVRVYPKGTRVSSTNYEPHRYWSSGAQLVALNWQTCGKFGSKFITTEFSRDHRLGLCDQPCDVPAQRPVWICPQATCPPISR
jgi:phosphatidylinositol phospholipase C delta